MNTNSIFGFKNQEKIQEKSCMPKRRNVSQSLTLEDENGIKTIKRLLNQ